jgi:hypothetical protein
VGVKRQTKRALLAQYLAARQPALLAEAEFGLLRERLAPISESYLRGLLRASGLELDAAVEGVRQRSFEELERTLLALAEAHRQAVNAGDRERAASCRRAVLTGKDHARLAARRSGISDSDRTKKEEMAAWMLLWLENPAVFPAWLALRKRAAATG